MSRMPAFPGGSELPIAEKDVAETFAESDLSKSLTDTDVVNESIELLNSELVDDAEDGDISVKDSAWSGWTGSTGSLTNQTTTVLSGSRTLELTAANADVSITASRESTRALNSVSFLVEIDNLTGTTGDDVQIELRDADGFDIGHALFRYTGDTQISNTAGGSWSANTTYLVEFTNIDYSAETLDGQITRVSDGTVITNVDAEPFLDSASGIGSIYANVVSSNSGQTVNLYLDDLETFPTSDATLPTTGSAIVEWPAPADVFRWDAATFQATEDGETVKIDVQESTDGGSTWTTIATDITRGQDISNADPSGRVRLVVNLDRASTANNPTCDALARRWVL